MHTLNIFIKIYFSDIYFIGGFGTVAWVDVKEYEALKPDKIAVDGGEQNLKVNFLIFQNLSFPLAWYSIFFLQLLPPEEVSLFFPVEDLNLLIISYICALMQYVNLPNFGIIWVLICFYYRNSMQPFQNPSKSCYQ